MTHPLLERVRAQGGPLVDGQTVTFLWQGRKAPRLSADFTDWEPAKAIELERIAPGLWASQRDFPPDAFIEYAFTAGDEHLNDPFNPRRVSNGMGKFNNWVGLGEYRPTPLARRKRGAAQGALTRHAVRAGWLLATPGRSIELYQPAGGGASPYPLLVVFDGPDYRRRARLLQVVDNLIAAGRIGPLGMALLAHGRQARVVEYGCSDITLMFLETVALPLAREQLNLLDPAQQPGAFAVMGASMGGVMALYSGLRMPHIFGRVISQSGAFALHHREMVVFDLARAAATPLDIWMSVGRYEALLDTNRKMFPLLQAGGHRLAYREFNAGHNYTAWRDDLALALEALFKPGLPTG